MRGTAIPVVFSLFVCAAADAAVEDFDCNGARALVELLASGADAVHEQVSVSPQEFVTKTIDGWKCVPQPLEMKKQGRIALDNLTCVYTTEQTRLLEKDFLHAGEVFKRGVGRVLECFKGEISNQAPKNYRGQVRGEGLLFLLDRDVRSSRRADGRPISRAKVLLEYGYFRAEPGSPLYWEVVVGASIHDSENPATARETAPPATVVFDSWEEEGGGGAAFSLHIDNGYAGRLSNKDGSDTLDLGELKPGRHTFELKQVRLYDPWGRQVSSGGWCSGSFVREWEKGELSVTLVVFPDQLRCSIE